VSGSAPIQQRLMDISSLVSKLIRKNFGRGPDSCHAFAKHHFLVFYMRGFLSPMEVILFEHGKLDHLKFSRNLVMKSVLENLKGVLEHEFELNVQGFYNDWKFEKNTGMITVVFEKDISTVEEKLGHFPEYGLLIDEFERISSLIQKKPKQTEAYQITPKLYLVKRMGILTPIEKALIAKGYQQILLDTLSDMENSYFRLDGRFANLFRQPIADIFVDWDLKEDHSITCLLLR